jgi:cation:H+ antiporter
VLSVLLFVLLGLLSLLAGGTALVRGASALATRTGVSPLLVGLTVVAFGTSAPELVVTVLGALEGVSDLAYGNVVGSNIANIGLVLACAAVIAPVTIEGQLIRREVPLLLLGTAILVVMSLDNVLRGFDAILDRGDGLVLVLLFTIFIYITVGDVRRRRQDPLVTGAEILPVPPISTTVVARDLAYLLFGFVGLAIGGQLTITYGAELAAGLGVPNVVVGLCVVAVGTSLPELVTSIAAAVKKEPDLCVGNVVGSNLMNGLLVLPIGALVRPITVPDLGLLDLLISFVLTASLIPIFFIGRSRLGRPIGGALLLGYISYLALRTGFS